MKKVGSSFKILSGLIVGGMILCLLFKMLSREGFSACIPGGKCNTAKGDTSCVYEFTNKCSNLRCTPGVTGEEGKWVKEGGTFTCN